MSPVPLSIDPALMTQLISLMKRLSTTVPEVGAQVRAVDVEQRQPPRLSAQRLSSRSPTAAG